MSEAVTATLRRDSAERRRATYQDVLDAPLHRVAEVVDGVLHTNPRPAMRHAHASSSLGTKIGGPFHHDAGGPGGWWIIFEPELHLGDDILVPDLAGWRRERMPVFPDAPYTTLTPDWVCEVLSPSTRKLDLHGKRAAYGREQVGHLWLVDPADRTLEAFELREGEWVLIATAQDDASVCIRPFDAVTFSLGDLWPPKVATAASPRSQRVRRSKLDRESFLNAFVNPEHRRVAARLLDVASESGANVERYSNGLGIRIPCSHWEKAVGVAWLFPPSERGRAVLRGLTAVSLGISVDLPAKEASLPDDKRLAYAALRQWVDEIAGCDFAKDASTANYHARTISYDDASRHIDQLSSSLARVVSEIISSDSP